MQQKTIKTLSVGAVLWDIIDGKEYIGGAPFNVAVNLNRLGAVSAFVTRIGKDGLGQRAEQCMKDYGVRTDFVQTDSALPTGTAQAVLDERRNAVYNIPYAAFDEIGAGSDVTDRIRKFAPDAICFGSFEQRNMTSRAAIRKILTEVKASYVFFDVNLRMDFCDKDVLDFSFRHSNIVKMNEEERDKICTLFYGEKKEERQFADRFISDFGLTCLIVTLGEKGCEIYTSEKTFRCSSEKAGGAGDTIGAGDAFSSAFLYAILCGADEECAARCGTCLGSYVAGKTGALPEWDAHVREKLNQIMKEG